MFSGFLTRWAAAVAVAIPATPAALAYENPDDISSTLREIQPAIEEPGDVVLELEEP